MASDLTNRVLLKSQDRMTKGAYFLGIELEAPIRLTPAVLGGPEMEPGLYLYCGSAYGPGGLDARINRHLKRRKKLRWHVDRLTTRGRVRFVGRVPEGRECALVSQFSALSKSSFPVPGFGSSDCKVCPSHLIKVDAEVLEPFLAQMTMIEYF